MLRDFKLFLDTIKMPNHIRPEHQIKVFNILPIGRDTVAYVHLDARTVHRLLGCLTYSDPTLADVFDFEKLGIDANSVASISTDGYGVSATGEVDRAYYLPNKHEDFDKTVQRS